MDGTSSEPRTKEDLGHDIHNISVRHERQMSNLSSQSIKIAVPLENQSLGQSFGIRIGHPEILLADNDCVSRSLECRRPR